MKRTFWSKQKKIKPGWQIAVLIGSFFLFCGLVQSYDDGRPQAYPLKYPANFGSRFTIPADNPTTKEGVYLVRLLFYEKKLSVNNKLSCESCHQQKRAFTDGRRFSTGADNSLTFRNSMSLANLLWVRNFFWDGRSAGLEEQVIFPMTDVHEMGQSLGISASKLSKTGMYPPLFKKAFGSSVITGKQIVKALAQFERTLISGDSNYDRYLSGNYTPTAGEMRGMILFENGPDPEKMIRGANCGHCHGGPKTYKELFHNNGLDRIAADSGREKFTGQLSDRGRFRVPTLRNISLTAPYMHDGRFSTLEQVLDHYSDHIENSETLSSFLKDISNQAGSKTLGLTREEKTDIIAFLGMLTDSTFINNPEFSNPHSVVKFQKHVAN